MAFKKGDLIMGKDRTYPRSLYRFYREFKKGIITLKILALDGVKYPEEETKLESFEANQEDYTLATQQDKLDSGYITQSIDFILRD